MILGLSHEKGAITELLLFIISSCGLTVLKTVASCSFNDNFLAETEAVMFILLISNGALSPPLLPFLTETLRYQGNPLLESSVSLELVIMFSSKSQSEYNI